jgi:predicted small lipoprotein YifL
MVDRIREMNESQGSSLAARRSPARGAVLGACALSTALALAACGQKGPLFLPAQAGVAASSASAASGVPLAPVEGASSPGLPAAAK